jgi:Helix-turn-helix domain
VSDRPAVRVGEYVWLDRRGCQIVAAAMEYAARAAQARNGGAGIGPDVAWVRDVVRLAAEPPRPPDDDGGESATAPRPFTVVMPSSWPMLTVGEVAELRQVSPQAVRAALKAGRLAGERHRGGWLIREDQARSWMPGRRNGTRKAQDAERGG